MRLRNRLLLTFTLSILGTLSLFTYSIQEKLRRGYAENIEEIMVDAAQLLASLLEESSLSQGDAIDVSQIAKTIDAYKKKSFRATIFTLEKTKPALDVYVTDARGVVLYSSGPFARTGDDLSMMNDVKRTLAGAYGARSTRRDPGDRWSSVFYVAAPVRSLNGNIVGAVSVIKHREDAYQIVKLSLTEIVTTAFVISAVVIGFGLLLFLWLTHPLEALRRYATAIAEGQNVYLPKLGTGEVAELGKSFEDMRIALEGKKSIEHFAQLLTHELKSPLTAIQGAAELANASGVNAAQREKLLVSILEQSHRTKMIVEKLLQIAALEVKKELDVLQKIDLSGLIAHLGDSLFSLLEKKQMTLVISPVAKPMFICGDPFLIEQCLRNLLQNAIDFSEPRGIVTVKIEAFNQYVRVIIQDDGPGVPAFAKDKVFDKFFSLERSDTKRRGTGLGLTLVKEVMHLHRGNVVLESPALDDRGTVVTLTFPL